MVAKCLGRMSASILSFKLITVGNGLRVDRSMELGSELELPAVGEYSVYT